MHFNLKANNPFFVLRCLWQGLKLTTHKELRQYIIIPLITNLIIYTIALIVIYFYASGLSWIIFPLLFIAFLIITFFTFSLVSNLLLSPFYSYLSAKTLFVITGQTEDIKEQPVMKVFYAEFKRLIYTLKLLLPLSLLFFIPVVNIAAPILFSIFGAWTLAMEYLAFPFENKGILFNEQKKLMQNIRFGTLTLGGLIMMGLTVPFLNVIIAPAAVIGATIYVNEIVKHSININ